MTPLVVNLWKFFNMPGVSIEHIVSHSHEGECCGGFKTESLITILCGRKFRVVQDS